MSAVSRQERWAFWGDGNAAMKPSANLDRLAERVLALSTNTNAL